MVGGGSPAGTLEVEAHVCGWVGSSDVIQCRARNDSKGMVIHKIDITVA